MKECPVCRRCFPDHFNNCPNDGNSLMHSIAGEPVLDGRYQLEARLGQGGMGVVYRARHIFLKTSHAIKVILPDLVGNDPMLVTRFRQEAMAAAAIRHQNIIAVTDFGVARGTMPFLVMEYVQGKSLHDILEEKGRLLPAEALDIMAGVAAGVGAAHRHGIVHRDLKPLNIMLMEGMKPPENIKVLDFGLAKIKSGELLGSFVAAQTTGLMGSPFYMAPEQWSEEEPDVRADVYSLGVILFQMLAGDVPFKAPSIPAIMKKHLMGEPPAFSVLNANVPQEIEKVVLRALEKNPDRRPQSVEEFIGELRDAVARTSGRSFERTQMIDSFSETIAGGQGMQDSLGEMTSAGFAGTISSGAINPTPQPDQAALERERLEREEMQKRQQQEAQAAQQRLEEERRQRELEEKRRQAEQREREERERKEREQRETHFAREREEQSHPVEARATHFTEDAKKEKSDETAFIDEDVQFTVYRPKVVEIYKWYTLLAFAHLSERRVDAPADEPDPLVEVQRLAGLALGEELDDYKDVRQDSSQAVPRKGELTFVPAMEGVEFNPPSASFFWQKSVHKVEFGMRASRSFNNNIARGRLTVFLGSIILAEVPLSVRVETHPLPESRAPQRVKEAVSPYRKIFASYSHKDREIVEQIEHYAQVLGDKYLRDVTQLRSGEDWERWMKQAIAEADIFQLFWSSNAMRSQYVRLEWEYALSLRRANFVRPTYWETPLPQSEAENLPPDELRRLHFQHLRAAASKSAHYFSKEEGGMREGVEQRDHGEREQREQQVLLSARPYAAPPERQPRQTLQSSMPATPQQSFQQQELQSPPPSLGTARPKKSRLPIIAGGSSIFAILMLAGITGIYFAFLRLDDEVVNNNYTMNSNINANYSVPRPSPSTGGSAIASRAEMVAIAGGTFQMGRSGGSASETPVRTVTVRNFSMDKTEVTNAEYAEFVKAKNHPAPSSQNGASLWSGNKPPAGQEKWPVQFVAYDDAVAFARWRSERDGATYRLPTEEEWEYAARGGSAGNLYPWGKEWIEDVANLGTGGGASVDFPKPVGSFPKGATPTGLQDMIGNVWEWTSSKASFYPGNTQSVPAANRDQIVVRGGAHQSMYPSSVEGRGGRAFPASYRIWIPKNTKANIVGFRLVRAGS
ncbi:MAG: SUMF1/EgtB/PvdO family nonheme iron enzyme [Acidobacteriota bacterium]|nr:SUMF1/EgtB/PvdO family nonheme iron enzyme [Acidobacteriota bacterium]